MRYIPFIHKVKKKEEKVQVPLFIDILPPMPKEKETKEDDKITIIDLG